jgi:hypothetical protein
LTYEIGYGNLGFRNGRKTAGYLCKISVTARQQDTRSNQASIATRTMQHLVLLGIDIPNPIIDIGQWSIEGVLHMFGRVLPFLANITDSAR